MKENIGKLAIYQGKVVRIVDYDEYFRCYKIRRKAWTGKIVSDWHDSYLVEELPEENKGLQIGDPKK